LTRVRKTAESLWRAPRLVLFRIPATKTAYVLCDLPDNKAAVALGTDRRRFRRCPTKTTVLLTAEEVDRGVKVKVDYHAPGQ
jgi:hypothetical protein